MLPGKRILYQIRVKAKRPGDARFAVRITADQLKHPIVDEESTQCFDPATGATTSERLHKQEDSILPASIPIPDQTSIKSNDNPVVIDNPVQLEGVVPQSVSLSVSKEPAIEPKADSPAGLVLPEMDSGKSSSNDSKDQSTPPTK
jgi:hypothetical protein